MEEKEVRELIEKKIEEAAVEIAQRDGISFEDARTRAEQVVESFGAHYEPVQ